MRRLQAEFLDRTKRVAHRMVDVAESLESAGRSQRVVGRIVDQIVGSGTSVGANTREAGEAVSRADFCRCLGVVLKELSECRYWVEFVSERAWISPPRLAGLIDEATELSRVVNTIIARTRRNGMMITRPSR